MLNRTAGDPIKRVLAAISGMAVSLTRCTVKSTRRVVAHLRQIDPLSGELQVGRALGPLLLVSIPLLTFALVCLATSEAQVLRQSNCNSLNNFVRNLLFQNSELSTCQAVPFLSDPPTILLAFTCPFALVAYRLLRLRLRTLRAELEKTGLLGPEGETPKLSSVISRLERSIDLKPTVSIGTFLLSSGMVTWLYGRNLDDGDLFETLAIIGPDGRSNSSELRESWWANYHHHPFLAILCIFIGSVGVTYALRAGWLYTMFGLVLYRTRKSDPESFPIKFVPRWRDKSYGWSPVTGVLMLIYASTINFSVSFLCRWWLSST